MARKVLSQRKGLDDFFYCSKRNERLRVGTCMDNYVDANAFHNQSSSCFNCAKGRAIRETFANSADLTHAENASGRPIADDPRKKKQRGYNFVSLPF